MTSVATPQTHLVRGLDIPLAAREAIEAKGVPVAFSQWIYGRTRGAGVPEHPGHSVPVVTSLVPDRRG